MTREELRENLGVALDTLRTHKVRSGLTVLGIVIGVTSVISVAAIIDGLNGFVQKKVESFGSRTFFISRIPFGTNPLKMPERIRIRKYLQSDYALKLRECCPSVEYVTTFGTRAAFFGGSGQTNEIRYGSERVERLIVRGVEPEYADAIPLFSIDRGRFISRYDEEHAKPVVALGSAIADSLFPHGDPVGKSVRLNGKWYEVIGVFHPDAGLFGGPGVDQFAIIPLSDFRKNYPESKEMIIAFAVARGADVERANDEMINAMRRVRRLPHFAENDFELLSPDFLSALWNQLTGALAILTGVISSVGLLVGGIGVMNIMLISVTERTQEIGVRKAIGARRSDIRAQFLLEAVLLTCSGGLIGIALGAVISLVVRTVAPSVPATVSPFWVALGVAMSVGVGLFFGYYPANRAANLDPIVCLRYE